MYKTQSTTTTTTDRFVLDGDLLRVWTFLRRKERETKGRKFPHPPEFIRGDDDGSRAHSVPAMYNTHKHTVYKLSRRTDAVRHVQSPVDLREKVRELVLVVFVVVVVVEVGDVTSETRGGRRGT